MHKSYPQDIPQASENFVPNCHVKKNRPAVFSLLVKFVWINLSSRRTTAGKRRSLAVLLNLQAVYNFWKLLVPAESLVGTTDLYMQIGHYQCGRAVNFLHKFHKLSTALPLSCEKFPHQKRG